MCNCVVLESNANAWMPPPDRGSNFLGQEAGPPSCTVSLRTKTVKDRHWLCSGLGRRASCKDAAQLVDWRFNGIIVTLERSVYLNRNHVLVASRADGLRQLCRDSHLGLATEIEISNVRLSDIPDEVFSARQLRALRITESRLKSVSHRINELSDLQELDLSQNSLDTLPSELGLLSRLNVLDVSCNRFQVFPDAISSLLSLVELDVSENAIASLPEEICKLRQLSVLVALDNKLTELPSCISVMTNLTMLDVTRNNLRDIPMTDFGYPSLKHLFIDDTALSKECLSWLHDKAFYS